LSDPLDPRVKLASLVSRVSWEPPVPRVPRVREETLAVRDHSEQLERLE